MLQTACVCVRQSGNSQLGFEDRNLVLCCLDLFLAGSETTSKTLQWGLIYLIRNPHIQGGCKNVHVTIAATKIHQKKEGEIVFFFTSQRESSPR